MLISTVTASTRSKHHLTCVVPGVRAVDTEYSRVSTEHEMFPAASPPRYREGQGGRPEASNRTKLSDASLSPFFF